MVCWGSSLVFAVGAPYLGMVKSGLEPRLLVGRSVAGMEKRTAHRQGSASAAFGASSWSHGVSRSTFMLYVWQVGENGGIEAQRKPATYGVLRCLELRPWCRHQRSPRQTAASSADADWPGPCPSGRTAVKYPYLISASGGPHFVAFWGRDKKNLEALNGASCGICKGPSTGVHLHLQGVP